MKTVMIAAAVLAFSASAVSADQALVQRSGCMGCHQVAKKVVGPSYKEIAAKHKGDAKAVDNLAEAIRKGSRGVWGNVPMPPHPQVTEDNARRMATWIMAQ